MIIHNFLSDSLGSFVQHVYGKVITLIQRMQLLQAGDRSNTVSSGFFLSNRQLCKIIMNSERIPLGGARSDDLQKVSLNIIDNNQCQQLYEKSRTLKNGIVSSQMCAGFLTGGKDTCLVSSLQISA